MSLPRVKESPRTVDVLRFSNAVRAPWDSGDESTAFVVGTCRESEELKVDYVRTVNRCWVRTQTACR